MAKYKVQHWLPSGYMKFFSITGTPNGRKSKIYYSDGQESKTKAVAKLSCKNYHYSQVNAEGAETSFHEIENDYPLIIDKILKGETLYKKEYFGIILTMIDFHARNPSYKNLTLEENYKAFEIVSKGLMREVFEGCDDCLNEFKIMNDFLVENWVLQPICSPKEEFISSDHPSLLFSTNDKLAFIFLPITPNYGLVAADKRKIEIIGNEASLEDNGNLNAMQAFKCLKYVYSNIDLSDLMGVGKPLTKWFDRERSKGFVKLDSWKPEFIDYTSNFPKGFSFLKVINS